MWIEAEEEFSFFREYTTHCIIMQEPFIKIRKVEFFRFASLYINK